MPRLFPAGAPLLAGSGRGSRAAPVVPAQGAAARRGSGGGGGSGLVLAGAAPAPPRLPLLAACREVPWPHARAPEALVAAPAPALGEVSGGGAAGAGPRPERKGRGAGPAEVREGSAANALRGPRERGAGGRAGRHRWPRFIPRVPVGERVAWPGLGPGGAPGEPPGRVGVSGGRVPAPAGIPGRGPQSFSRGRRQSRDGPCVRLVQPSLSVSSGGGLEPLLGLTRFTTLVRSY